MCSTFLLLLLAFICLECTCTSLLLLVPGGSHLLGLFFLAGLVLLLFPHISPSRQNEPPSLLPAILLMIPGILTDILGVVLLVPAWRQRLFSRLHPAFQEARWRYTRGTGDPPPPRQEDDDPIEVEVTETKDDN